MLNNFKPNYIRIHVDKDLYFLNRTKSFLFFFKFIKLKKFFQFTQNSWNDSIVFLRNHQNINVRNWLWSMTKKKKYKPYSFFKFNILKYRRVFDPKHWYNFNYYLLTRFNHLYFKGPCITNLNSYGRSIGKSIYLQMNESWVLKKKFSNFTKVKIGIYVQNLVLKQSSFAQIVTVDKLKRAEYWHHLTKAHVLSRFIPWWKYRTRLTFKNLRFRSIKYGKTPDFTYQTVNLTVKRLYRPKLTKFNGNVVFTRTNNKLITAGNRKSNSYLTGFSYKQRLSCNAQKSNILTLKILFNSYNYKTYNWRVVN